MYSIQDLAKHIDNIPELFRHNDLLDVTKLHNIGSCDVTVSTNINKEKENFLSVFFIISVRVNPGATAFTRIFFEASSLAAVFVIAITAPLVAE